MISFNDLAEIALIGGFFICYLAHLPFMLMILKSRRFRDRNLNLYFAISILPLLISAPLLVFGGDDLASRGTIRQASGFLLGGFAIHFLVCTILLFTKVSGLSRTTRAMVLLSTFVSGVTSAIAVTAAGFATV